MSHRWRQRYYTTAPRTGADCPRLFCRIAAAQAAITREIYTKWQGVMNSQKCRERVMLLRQADVAEAVKHDSTHWLLRRAGRNHRPCAHATRLISGHFLHGEFCN